MDACYTVGDLTKVHRGRRGSPDVLANSGIDLVVARGEVFGLLGPNGAGKTTLLRQLTGVLRPDSGAIDLLGHDLVADPRVAARLVAYLPQEDTTSPDVPAGVAVTTVSRLRGASARSARAECAALFEELGLDVIPGSDRDRSDRGAAIGGRPLRRLSGGQRRLVAVAAALAGERPVLVLDEPTTGLDPVARRAVWAALGRRRERGTTVVLVTHNVLEAESFVDCVAVIDDGSVIASGSPAALKAKVGGDVRLDVVWREDPPAHEPAVRSLAERAVVTGRRWTVRTDAEDARALLGALLGGPAFAALDDFTLTTPTLEDVYLALGGRHELERA